MFLLVAAGWAIFRATSFAQVFYLFTHLGLSKSASTLSYAWQAVYFTLPMLIVQVFQARAANQTFVNRLNPWARGLAYGVILVGIVVFSQREVARFIYQGF